MFLFLMPTKIKVKVNEKRADNNKWKDEQVWKGETEKVIQIWVLGGLDRT